MGWLERISMSTECDGESATHYTYHPGPDESVSEAVVWATANRSDRSLVDDGNMLPPLYEAIDPDALDALFSASGADPTIEFLYAGYRVTVDGARQVTVAEA